MEVNCLPAIYGPMQTTHASQISHVSPNGSKNTYQYINYNEKQIENTNFNTQFSPQSFESCSYDLSDQSGFSAYNRALNFETVVENEVDSFLMNEFFQRSTANDQSLPQLARANQSFQCPQEMNYRNGNANGMGINADGHQVAMSNFVEIQFADSSCEEQFDANGFELPTFSNATEMPPTCNNYDLQYAYQSNQHTMPYHCEPSSFSMDETSLSEFDQNPLKRSMGRRRQHRGMHEAQRQQASQRERVRMKKLNSAFDKLRVKIPTLPYEKKLSKVETLRSAINYIHVLLDLMESSEPASKSDENDQAENRSAKRKKLSSLAKLIQEPPKPPSPPSVIVNSSANFPTSLSIRPNNGNLTSTLSANVWVPPSA